jgi:hypothetical protein
LERIKFDRELAYACHCHLYEPDEQCDCAFCISMIKQNSG